ncbi:hypothetical protein ELH72_30155 (plasmid) [Rhizobium ruizarguesonis]|jgi:hypothetical protein|uniref:hypothetical protein n=1 Tax=Rhizobium ruizarguesonis TaxID=2081791 RepID=UPI00102FDD61|nr:hypothetical protein [Rhizobium ruizarguesonis]TAZ70704.1 hypothetical protein ELH72_30155 [Rhizobium ruizarguesonis]
MSHNFLSVSRLERRFSSGNVEELAFHPGVNLLIGRPNTGKTKWLQTLDFLLGDTGENPFEGAEETGLAEKYEAAAAYLVLGDQEVRIERRWREPGAKTKVFVNDEGMPAREFQQWLMQSLGIPLLSFPKGNPMSGQTWPELSFRMLLRHIYRQQRFWGAIADQQPDGEQHACLLQFLGLAERIYTIEYGELVGLKLEAEKLKARREQYGHTLDELARDVLAEPGLTVSVTPTTIQAAQGRLGAEIEELRNRRNAILIGGRERAIPSEDRGYVARLGEQRADVLARLEEYRRKLNATSERTEELNRYRMDVADELDRIARAEDAGEILADLRITHCPACDQSVSVTKGDLDHCFLCHQHLPDEPIIEELGAVRLRFEKDRLSGELEEADELLTVLKREQKMLGGETIAAEENLRSIENELVPARQAVAGLVQSEISAIDVALGQASERDRQIRRIAGALELGADLTKRIAEIETRIEPLQLRVDELARATDFDAAATLLEDGMNDYLNAINVLRPGVWRHNPVNIDLSRSGFTFRVGTRRWNIALGGTDTLYFLMAYHYGLLTLTSKNRCHYPGLAIIDVPGEFSGEAVEDKENFIVQPFIDLLNQDEYSGAQLILTGASFAGLEHAHSQRLTHVHVA